MKVGKVPPDILQKTVFNKTNIQTPQKYSRTKHILKSPGIGEDCSLLRFGDHICALSSDPITGAVNDIGRLCVHVSCNDIASCGIMPFGILVTILLPEGSSESDLDVIMDDIFSTCRDLEISVLGGHTEVTTSVRTTVICATAIGYTCSDNARILCTSDAKAGDFIIVTKSVGLEGAAILAKDKKDVLIPALGAVCVSDAQNFLSQISVVSDGIIGARNGATAMHDVTEGGIFGAVWEVAEASGTGFELDLNKIPVSDSTRRICDFFNISPYKLMSSGCMLMTSRNPDILIKALNENNISATVVGRLLPETQKRVVVTEKGIEKISRPESDELYKVI